MPRRLALLCVPLLVWSTSAFATNINDFVNMLRGAAQGAIIHQAQVEWRNLQSNEIDCVNQALRQQGVNLDALINHGLLPSDPRLSQLRSNCRGQTAQAPQGGGGHPSPYVVDGLALYGQVRFDVM